MQHMDFKQYALMQIFDIPETEKATINAGHEFAITKGWRLVGNGSGRWRFMDGLARGVKRPPPKPLPVGRPRSYGWAAVENLAVGESTDVQLSDASTALQHVRNQATRIRRKTGAVFSVSASTQPRHATVRRTA